MKKRDGGLTRTKKGVLKGCFKNSLYATIEYDIWLLIIEEVDLPVTIQRISELSRGFRCLTEDTSRTVLRKALEYRKNTKIVLARHFLLKAVTVFENTDAMVHLGNACFEGGWLQRQSTPEGLMWLEKAAKRGNALGMVMYKTQNWFGCSMDDDLEIQDLYKRQIMNSGKRVAQLMYDWYHIDKNDYFGKRRISKEMSQLPEKEDNEFVQYALGMLEEGKDGFNWLLRAAEQGSYKGIIGFLLCLHVRGDYESAVLWRQKAQQQEIKK